ncbi:MAG: VRR-NUC domain-containing protein, partial [Anaerolineae bacterium]|nr:VRR-NUC domain-containing protein [Anaerolineae bacterium]
MRIGRRFVRFGRNGSGDVLGVLPPNGQFISVEIKTVNDRLTDKQIEWMKRVRALGGIAIVAECVSDIESVLIPFCEVMR